MINDSGTPIVQILTGDYKGQNAFVTWQSLSEQLVRVTPVTGDPLVSIELPETDIKYIRK